eukprot:scaffold35200_cov42-Phaeocystis_antarctica.AAC.1
MACGTTYYGVWYYLLWLVVLLTMACGATYYGAPDEAELRLAVLLLDGEDHAALLPWGVAPGDAPAAGRRPARPSPRDAPPCGEVRE